MVDGFMTVAPVMAMAPEQFVFVAVSVEEVKPKPEKQPVPPVAAAVTVKPTGKVTVSVPESGPCRVM